MTFAFILQSALGPIIQFLPFILIFAVFYFLIIMPQRKRQQQLQATIAALKAGDKIITTGGIIAKIAEVRDASFIIRTADKSIIEISRAAVAGMHGEEGKKD
jgi:preprotein translocase subunit YajC